MFIYAGIDEAGYGPIFGPLVVARTVFAVEERPPPEELPNLWRLLRAAVCRKPADVKRRVAVDDSKALYTPALGLRHLERGVLGFLPSAGVQAQGPDALLEALACDPESHRLEHPWYAPVAGAPEIPVHLEEEDLSRARGRIERASSRSGVRLVDTRAAVVLEDRFNRLFRETRSKSASEWIFVGRHLREIWDRFGSHAPRVVVDRQGGRRYYGEAIATLFPEASLEVWAETARLSHYRVEGAGRSMEVLVQVESERFHLPVALSSMTAKYLRELLMMRFQDFWRRHAPGVRPTYGYFGDGRRFLREIEPRLAELRIDRDLAVRCC